MDFYKPASGLVFCVLTAALVMNTARAEDTIPDCASVGYDPLVKDAPFPKVEACKHGRNLIVLGDPAPADKPITKATPVLPISKQPVPATQEKVQFGAGTQF